MYSQGVERIIPLPEWDAKLAASIVNAVPDKWSDLSGRLNAPEPMILNARALRDTGYSYKRFDNGVEIQGRQLRIDYREPDYVTMLLEQKLPGFVLFDETGFDQPKKFLIAKKLASGFVAMGYTGWLRFSSGVRREYAHENPATCILHLEPWHHKVRVCDPWIDMPPALVVNVNKEHGGKPEDVAPILEVCSKLPYA